LNLYKMYGLAAGLTAALFAFALFSAFRHEDARIPEDRSGAATLPSTPTATQVGQGISRNDFVQVRELDNSLTPTLPPHRSGTSGKEARTISSAAVAEPTRATSAPSHPVLAKKAAKHRVRHRKAAKRIKKESPAPETTDENPPPEFDAPNPEESPFVGEGNASAEGDASPTELSGTDLPKRRTRGDRSHRRRESGGDGSGAVHEETTVVEETHNPDGTEEVIREHQESRGPE